jgi:hypothetical protein
MLIIFSITIIGSTAYRNISRRLPWSQTFFDFKDYYKPSYPVTPLQAIALMALFSLGLFFSLYGIAKAIEMAVWKGEIPLISFICLLTFMLSLYFLLQIIRKQSVTILALPKTEDTPALSLEQNQQIRELLLSGHRKEALNLCRRLTGSNSAAMTCYMYVFDKLQNEQPGKIPADPWIGLTHPLYHPRSLVIICAITILSYIMLAIFCDVYDGALALLIGVLVSYINIIRKR